MEEQPSYETSQSGAGKPRKQRAVGFGQRLGIVLLVSLAGSVLFALIAGPRDLPGFSNGLFIAGAILLIIGLLPLLGDIFSRSTLSFRKGDRTMKDVLDDERERSKRDDNTSVLFSVAGIIIMALSFIIGFSA
jgi:hypothetical protein